MKRVVVLLNFLFVIACYGEDLLNAPLFTNESLQQIPIAYNGRIRPLNAASRLWLYDLYNNQKIKTSQQKLFHLSSGNPIELEWKLYFFGHAAWDNAPLFWIHYADLKLALGLDLKRDHFSYNELHSAISNEFEATHKAVADEALKLTSSVNHYSHIQSALNADQTSSLLHMLPGRYQNGEWYSLNMLKAKVFDLEYENHVLIGNFTIYPNELFEEIRTEYFLLEQSIKSQVIPQIHLHTEALAKLLLKGYESIAGTPYKEAYGKVFLYPTITQLQVESYYYAYPLTEIAILFYAVTLILFTIAYKKSTLSRYALALAITAFCFQTLLLIMRCYILQRPPVSNMFETVIYVPWIAMIAGFFLRYFLKSNIPLFAASFSALALLILLKLTNLTNSLENVQAVLDSQYWLIVHVLMVVSSYGVFLLGGVLGHFYLVSSIVNTQETAQMQLTARLILQTLYVGVALLIPGTILGGVWAAESWGRFWDWDPKESWAFISSCIYLIWIHAHTFRYIRNFGLAIGAIIGLLTISFTWYGVNYILGTGLHSYGFGSGGEHFYYLFFLAEVLFLAYAYIVKKQNIKKFLESK